jgi:hypothetical protein
LGFTSIGAPKAVCARRHWTGVDVIVSCINDKNRQNEQPGLEDEQTWSLEFPSNPAFTMTPTTPSTIHNQPCSFVGRIVAAAHNRRGGSSSATIVKGFYFNNLSSLPSVARALV